ncbi:MAG: sulfotransferase [Rhodanobacteraceae bacterium]
MVDAAEDALRVLLAKHPGDAASAFSLARLLRDRGRTAAAAEAMRMGIAANANRRDANLAIAAIELLDECDRKHDAAAIAEAAIAANPDDPRLHAYAGMLAIQMGEFERAREHYVYALDHDPRAVEWHVPIGLSSTLRYEDTTHPDFARFRAELQRDGLPDLARAELHFALGKACDDIGDYAGATQHFKSGNAIRKRGSAWSRKIWRRGIEARLAAPPNTPHAKRTPGFSPIFIVGMPRSGTTLLAERLAWLPGICNRGEQPWLARLALQPDLNGAHNSSAPQRAAATYASRVRQDDAGDAQWFIDKQPLNFRYVDLALAMFPDVHIIHCLRNPRDNALSLWMQCFLEDVQGYSYDFGDIALVMRDCDKLMAHWQARYPDFIRTLRYEDLVASPRDAVMALAEWIGVPAATAKTVMMNPPSGNVISTASLWQARQPVNTRSIGRWKHYAPHLPELLRFSEPGSSG